MDEGLATEVALPREPPGRTLRVVRRHPASIAWMRRSIVSLLLAAVCWAALAAAPVAAIEDPAVGRDGSCSDTSHWQLRLRTVDRGMLRVRFVIAGGAAGQEWNIFMDHNEEGFFAGSRISGDDGLVVVRRRVADLDGPDTIRATAHDTATGETCRARITL